LKVLITGATGYIGTYLLQYLSKKDRYLITALDIRNPVTSFDKKSIKLTLKDFTTLTKKDLVGYDAIIHLAGISGHADADADWKRAVKLNIWGTLDLAELAKEAGVKKFIFPSTSSVYQVSLGDEKFFNESAKVRPLDVYSVTKYEAENKILPLASNNFQVIIPRIGSVYGHSPRMRWDILVNVLSYYALKKGLITIYDEGKAWRPLIYIADVARFYDWALSQKVDSGIFNIIEGNYTVGEVAQVLIDNLRQKKVKLAVRPIENPQEVFSYKMDSAKAENSGFRSQFKFKDVIAEELKIWEKRKEFN